MSTQNKQIPYRFGEKLRAVRERKGYTLKVVAQKAGVSESLVSQIERNRVSPAIDTLLTLADVLDINLEFLFEEYRRDKPVRVIRKDERRKVEEDDVIYQELAKPSENDGEHAIECYLLTIPPKSTTHRGSYGHLGREFGYIMEGNATFQYESSVYELEAGDSISFSASSPHVLKNSGEKELKAIWVVTPPQRFNLQ